MNDLEPSVKCLSVDLLFPELFNGEVAGDEDSFRPDRSHLPKLILRLKTLMLAPFLQVSQHKLLILLYIIYENILLIRVAVPILGLVLLIVLILCLLYDIRGLSDTWLAPNPIVVQLFQSDMLLSAVLIEVYVRLDLSIVLDVDVPFLDCLLCTHLNEELISFCL